MPHDISAGTFPSRRSGPACTHAPFSPARRRCDTTARRLCTVKPSAAAPPGALSTAADRSALLRADLHFPAKRCICTP